MEVRSYHRRVTAHSQTGADSSVCSDNEANEQAGKEPRQRCLSTRPCDQIVYFLLN